MEEKKIEEGREKADTERHENSYRMVDKDEEIGIGRKETGGSEK